MAGLVGYGSSDEEDEVPEATPEVTSLDVDRLVGAETDEADQQAPQLHDKTKSETATECTGG